MLTGGGTLLKIERTIPVNLTGRIKIELDLDFLSVAQFGY
jgi:hypothetical protein